MLKIKSNNDANIISLNDSFLLRGIDPTEIMKNYHEGKYDNLKLPNTKIKLTNTITLQSHKIGTSDDDEFYKCSDKYGLSNIIVTTNHPRFIWYKNGGKDIPPFSSCGYCRKPIEGNHLPIGIPVKMVCTPPNQVTFYVEDCFHSFECCFTQLKKHTSYTRDFIDPHYTNSIHLLYVMLHIMHPHHEKLKELSDWRLLNINGGPLTDEEFFSENHHYIDTKNLVLIPVKRQFTKITINKNK